MKRIFKRFRTFFFKRIVSIDVLTPNNILALQHLNTLSSEFKYYYPYTLSAISPINLQIILNDIVINRRKNIVELGAGLSTLYIATLLKKNNIQATFYSIEENKEWASYIEKQLELEGVSDYGKVFHVPISESNNKKWYNLEKIEQIKQSIKKIDCLIVDAPAAYLKGNEKIRQGALPNFIGILDDSFSIFLDDSNREGEQSIIKDWEREFNIKLTIQNKLGYYVMGNNFNIF